MNTAAGLLQKITAELVASRGDVLRPACRQRAKWEGWLKFELAAAMGQQAEVSEVFLETSYQDGQRCDLSFSHGGQKWFVELKTANVNWRSLGVENHSRPITKNISSIIVDVRKLQARQAFCHGLVLFCLFPVPDRIWRAERDRLIFQLARIENECGLANGCLTQGGAYIPVTEEYGVCIYIVDTSVGTGKSGLVEI